MPILSVEVEISAAEPTGYVSQHVDVKLSRAEGALLWRVREHLKASLPKGFREVSLADAVRHLIGQCAAAPVHQSTESEVNTDPPPPVDPPSPLPLVAMETSRPAAIPEMRQGVKRK